MKSEKKAAALNSQKDDKKKALAGAGHRLGGKKCKKKEKRYEQFKDQAVPQEIRDLCAKVPRKKKEH